MPNRDLVVRFIGDDRDLQRAFSRSEKNAKQFAGRMTVVNQGLRGTLSGLGSKSSLLFGSGAFIGTAAFTAGAQKAVNAASDLNEQISRTEVVLGDSAAAVIKWSETTARNIGIAQRQALAANATFAGLFQTVGVAPARASELSRALVELAADLASLGNTNPEEALIALRSGLAGEAEPLRRFNIFLTEARVQLEAFNATGKSSAGQLTQQEKTLARYNLILQDSISAQGNFKLTSDGLANQTRILRANLDDLASNVGQVLVPVLTDAAEAANLLFVALEKFRGIDFSPGFEFPDPPDWLRSASIAPISPLGAVALSVKRALEDDDKGIQSITKQLTGSINKTIGGLGDALDKRADAIEKVQRRDLERARSGFVEFTKGLGLKLDKARLTATLSDDLAVLRELERAILRRIAAEGKTFQLVEQLTAVRLQINSVVQTQADDARQAGIDAFDATLDALDLQLEIAQSTKSFADDRAALRSIERAILDRIEAEGETTDLLRQLFQVRQQQADVAKQLAEQKRERRQGRQFEALGLTEEGERPTPGVGALRRRLGNLREQIKGTTLDTEKTRRELDQIAKVLAGKFGAVGKEVRDAILQMFNDIAGALDQGGKQGPLTKTSGLNTKKILDGLGLSDAQINELRGRLSSVNTAGRQLANIQTTVPGGSGSRGGQTTTTGPIVVENELTIVLDGKRIHAFVTKENQKTERRNPKQKRGPNRNR